MFDYLNLPKPSSLVEAGTAHPTLIDHSFQSYMKNTLYYCHEKRIVTYGMVLNVGVISIFLATLLLVLYISRKNKPTEYQRQQQLLRDQQYVLSKIRFYQEMQKKRHEETSITGLPMTGPNLKEMMMPFR